MSLQLPTILSPPTPCIPFPRSLSRRGSMSLCCRSPFPGSFPFWASPFPSRLANASGRIEFIIFLIMDWLFASGCFPPRLSTAQLPSTTDSQCSVRRGLPPRCWCALSGALGSDLRADLREKPIAFVDSLEGLEGRCSQGPGWAAKDDWLALRTRRSCRQLHSRVAVSRVAP